MTQITDTIMQMMGGGANQRISRELGTNEQTTQTAIAAALPMLMAALARNSSSSEGATSLFGALSRDHDGSVLDQPDAVVNQAGEGPGILRHVLGARQPVAQEAVAKASGMDMAKAGQLLIMLAPLVMGALGRAQRQKNLDPSGVAGMLGQEREQLTQQAPGLMGLATRLLDRDGDGSIVDDLGGMAGKLFGGR